MKVLAIMFVGLLSIFGVIGAEGYELYETATETLDSGTEAMEQAAILTKNSELEQFEGNISGSEVLMMVRRINAYNDNDIFPGGVETIYQSTNEKELSQETIDRTAKYDVSFAYGESGYITKAIIKGTPKQ